MDKLVYKPMVKLPKGSQKKIMDYLQKLLKEPIPGKAGHLLKRLRFGEALHKVREKQEEPEMAGLYPSTLTRLNISMDVAQRYLDLYANRDTEIYNYNRSCLEYEPLKIPSWGIPELIEFGKKILSEEINEYDPEVNRAMRKIRNGDFFYHVKFQLGIKGYHHVTEMVGEKQTRADQFIKAYKLRTMIMTALRKGETPNWCALAGNVD